MLNKFKLKAILFGLIFLFITSSSFAKNCAELLTSSFIKDVHQYIQILKSGKKGPKGELVIVTDSHLVQQEFTQISTNLASALHRIPSKPRHIPWLELQQQIDSFLETMQAKFEANEYTYQDFLITAQFHADVFEAIHRLNEEDSDALLRLGFEPKDIDQIRNPLNYKNTRFIPTTQDLSIYVMNQFSTMKFGFLGLVTENIFVDDKWYSPARMMNHDFTHVLLSGFGSLRVYNKIFRKVPPEQLRIRHAIWFHFWHEFTWKQYKGRSLLHFKLYVEDLQNKKTQAYQSLMTEIVSNKSYGVDDNLQEDVDRYWNKTLRALLKL